MKFYFFAATLGFVHNPLTIKDYVHFTVYTVSVHLKSQYKAIFDYVHFTVYTVQCKL